MQPEPRREGKFVFLSLLPTLSHDRKCSSIIVSFPSEARLGPRILSNALLNAIAVITLDDIYVSFLLILVSLGQNYQRLRKHCFTT